jgi:hypothetical protein
LCLEHVDHWERIASRWRPAFSSHLINTIVSNVGEDFIALIKPKAAKLFFVSSDDKETVYYREKVRERLNEKFKAALEAKPQGTTFRDNGTWLIDDPNFSKKEGRRVFWTSRIAIDVDFGVVEKEDKPQEKIYLSNLLSPMLPELTVTPQKPSLFYSGLTNLYSPENVITFQGLATHESQKKVISHKGRDIFEVRWSTEVTMSKDLRKPIIEDIVHVELSYQPIL